MLQDEAGHLPKDRPVWLKISGDGARMTRLTGFILLSFALLEDNEDYLSSKGTVTFCMYFMYKNELYVKLQSLLDNIHANKTVCSFYFGTGTTTVAVLSGGESYDNMRIGFQDVIKDVNQIIKDGHIEITSGKKS